MIQKIINHSNKITLVFIVFIVVVVVGVMSHSVTSYENGSNVKDESKKTEDVKKEEVISRVKTPSAVKAIYMSACFAATPSLRDKLVSLVRETELNSIIVDIKDYTGTVSFKTGNPGIDDLKGNGCSVSDMKEFIKRLHEENIYVIGRITVFQDPLYTKAYPEYAVKRKSDGGVWKDRKGISFVDVGARPFWDHIISIATSSYAIGFDEINFDYIRYPSDGNMKDIDFTHSGTVAKKEMLRQFFEYLDTKLKGTGIVTSADLFGMTTTNTDDLNIGQILEYGLMYFDYVAPMVYPSHYPPTFNGWPDPNKVPYELIKFTMESAVSRAEFLRKEIASSTPNSPYLSRINKYQLRPWLQDFDYPVHYTPKMVRDQITATYDAGLNSWMLWDPSNTYTKEALEKEN